MYKDKYSGFSLARIPSIDISIIVAMFALVVMAWGVSKLDRSFVSHEAVTPVFAISSTINVTPVIEPATNKDAKKVGRFMSLAKAGTATGQKTAVAEISNSELSKSIAAESGIMPAAVKLIAPKIIYKTIPDYPVKAVEAGLSGTVMVKVYILKNGRVGDALVESTSGHAVLDKSAIAAVSQWIFEPAVMGKETTEAYFKVPVRFQLKS